MPSGHIHDIFTSFLAPFLCSLCPFLLADNELWENDDTIFALFLRWTFVTTIAFPAAASMSYAGEGMGRESGIPDISFLIASSMLTAFLLYRTKGYSHDFRKWTQIAFPFVQTVAWSLLP